MIELIDLEIGYSSKTQTVSVYKNIHQLFALGNLVGLIGNNGVGKSTLLKTITGNLKPLSGSVLVNKKNSSEYTLTELAQLISIVTTEKIGGFNLTVYDVVAFGRTPYINIFAKLTDSDEKIITQSLDKMSISHLKNKLIDEISDGQRQKVMIAKSLAQHTPVIILDEPTAFLDYNSKHHLFSVLKQLCETENKLIIVSTHDLDLLKQYSDSTIELKEKLEGFN